MKALLPEEPADTDRDEGANLLDMTELAPAQRRIMRLMIRALEMGHGELCRALEGLPEGERIAGDELERALAELSEHSWLLASGSEDSRRYRVNFRRRPGRTLSQVKPHRRSGTSLGKSVWDALESGTAGEPSAGGGTEHPGADAPSGGPLSHKG